MDDINARLSHYVSGCTGVEFESEIDVPKTKKPLRTIEILAKCNDCFSANLVVDGRSLKEYSGYVPAILGVGDGDEVFLTIDLNTDRILNWNVPDEVALQEFIGDQGESQE